MEQGKTLALKRRVRKAGLITKLIAKSAIWYPVKILILVLWKLISFCLNILFTVLIIGAVTGVVVACAFLLYIQSNIETTYDGLNNLKFDSSLNTTLYYTDDTGTEVLLEDDTLHGSENRLWAEYREIPQDLIDAFVSIEDKRYFFHNGVDLRRTLGAVINYFIPGGSAYGGSSLTQQLIKNVSQETDTTIQRKVQEIFRALYVEKHFSKEEILEMYLNVISFSQNTNGVKAAARTYFNKELKDLTLVECAALAAIPKYPTYYDPLRNPDNNLLRRNLVLKTMLENGYITQEEFDSTYNVPLYLNTSVQETESGGEKVHSYYIDAVIEDVTKALMERYNIDRTTASRKLYSGGLQIVVNMDPDVQSIMESVFTDENCFPKTTGIKFQAAMVVMDPTTGKVLGIVGGRGEKTVNRGLNRATQSTRQCGSSIKPLSIYAYAIDRGIINYGTPMLDLPIEYREEDKTYWPPNAPVGYDGIISLVSAVQESKNTTAVRLVQEVGLINSFDFLVNTLGFTTLVERREYGGVIKSDITVSPLALGSFTEGVTVLEVTQGYTMFSNGGAVSKAMTFSMVRDSNGEIIIDNRTPEQKQAVSEQSAYIMTKILQTVISSSNGTANYMFRGYLDSPAFAPKVEVAGKTGTTNDDRDRYFVGYTPDFTASVWVGYDNNKSLSNLKYNPATRLWIEVFNRIYGNLDAKNKAYKKSFDEPYGIIKTQYCIISGKLVNEPCKYDLQQVLKIDGFNAISTGYFTNSSVPTEYCDTHVMYKWDKDKKALYLDGCTCSGGNLIDVSLRRITPRIFQTNLTVADSQFTCIDPALLGSNYTYPTSRTVPYFYNIYQKGTYPGKSGSSSAEPYNRICIEHYSPGRQEEQFIQPGDILTGGG